ncbi:putative transcription factor WD40-like family [Rosa chinensis]|uniref:Putative transcription factor WD40-like family n=1 Tax=Rosa chinensis TaxID=74649 RepID=A0A2P6Q419_ROSCH|nr:putative transcription factor WD40-like family [Rosa chinensis]
MYHALWVLPLSFCLSIDDSGKVRLGEVLEDGQVRTKDLGMYHCCDTCSLAVEAGNPHILYTCGGDEFVRQFDLRSNCARRLLQCSRLARGKYYIDHNHYMALHDIVINPRNPNYFCTGSEVLMYMLVSTTSENYSGYMHQVIKMNLWTYFAHTTA